MFSYNRVIACGNAGKDAEMKATNAGKKMCRFSVATSEKRGDQERTTWFDVTVLNERLAEMCAQIAKGDKVLVEGKLEVRRTDDGKTYVDLIVGPFDGKVIFLSPKKDAQPRSTAGYGRSASAAPVDDAPPWEEPPY